MHADPWSAVSCIARSLGEFEAVIGDSYQYDLYCWKQVWSNTACGFGGIGGNAMTPAYTVVLKHGHKIYVFHNGKFAGEASFARIKTRECFDKQKMPGAADKAAWEEMQ